MTLGRRRSPADVFHIGGGVHVRGCNQRMILRMSWDSQSAAPCMNIAGLDKVLSMIHRENLEVLLVVLHDLVELLSVVGKLLLLDRDR